ncbi:MAG: PCRF domain-containing protein [Candidatus Moranbacteria bacterium]|nr:PCRF domain-containing protein [Candidatus Moranbacteria bacterium]
MQNIQDVFNHIREMKKEQKDLRDMYKDALIQADEYEEIVEEIKVLREKKQAIEARIQLQLGRAYEKFEDLKHEVETEKEMMNDIALSTLMKGETVVVKDEWDNEYEPSWKVGFKKANGGTTTGE